MLPTAPRRGCLAPSGRGLWRGAGRRVASSPPGGVRSESVPRAAPCETAAHALVCGLGRALGASAKPRARDCRSAIFRVKTSVIPRRHLPGFCVGVLALTACLPLHLGGVLIDIQSANPTSYSLVRHRAGKHTANAAHNTADRNQCAASDIGVSKDCLFSALASAKAAR